MELSKLTIKVSRLMTKNIWWEQKETWQLILKDSSKWVAKNKKTSTCKNKTTRTFLAANHQVMMSKNNRK